MYNGIQLMVNCSKVDKFIITQISMRNHKKGPPWRKILCSNSYLSIDENLGLKLESV